MTNPITLQDGMSPISDEAWVFRMSQCTRFRDISKAVKELEECLDPKNFNPDTIAQVLAKPVNEEFEHLGFFKAKKDSLQEQITHLRLILLQVKKFLEPLEQALEKVYEVTQQVEGAISKFFLNQRKLGIGYQAARKFTFDNLDKPEVLNEYYNNVAGFKKQLIRDLLSFVLDQEDHLDQKEATKRLRNFIFAPSVFNANLYAGHSGYEYGISESGIEEILNNVKYNKRDDIDSQPLLDLTLGFANDIVNYIVKACIEDNDLEPEAADYFKRILDLQEKHQLMEELGLEGYGNHRLDVASRIDKWNAGEVEILFPEQPTIPQGKEPQTTVLESPKQED